MSARWSPTKTRTWGDCRWRLTTLLVPHWGTPWCQQHGHQARCESIPYGSLYRGRGFFQAPCAHTCGGTQQIKYILRKGQTTGGKAEEFLRDCCGVEQA